MAESKPVLGVGQTEPSIPVTFDLHIMVKMDLLLWFYLTKVTENGHEETL